MVPARFSAPDGSQVVADRVDSRSVRSTTFIGLGIALIVLLLSLVIGWVTPGYEGDINQNKTWARQLVRNGMRDAYRGSIDYPPVPLYTFAAAGWVYQRVIDPGWNESAALDSHEFTFLMKIPVLVAHAALTWLLFVIGARSRPELSAVVALAYGLNPATLYDIAHFGQTDSLVGLAAVASVMAIRAGQPVVLAVSAALLILTKPQGWILLPLIGLAMLWRLNTRQVLIAVGSGALTLGLLLSPWLFTGRAHHLLRFVENLNEHAISNRVISADAHNLWWIPTLIHWDWIEDSAAVLGPITFRMVATVLAVLWLGLCIWASWTHRGRDLFLVTAAASFGFFMLMVRAHENHGYLLLPLLAGSLAIAPERQRLIVFVLGSAGLMMNLVLRDPFIMGPFTSVPDPGQAAPSLIVAAQVANVALNAVVLVLLGRLLLHRPSTADTSS